jgi:hypothetical protein
MTASKEHHEGGCFCGAVRYKITGLPDWSSHCHCRSCQRAVGAAYTTWIGVKAENFEVTKGEISTFTLAGAERGFCSSCGTSLTYIAEEGWPGQVSLLAPTLDEPGIASPSAHVYLDHKLPWVKLGDELEQYPQFP